MPSKGSKRRKTSAATSKRPRDDDNGADGSGHRPVRAGGASARASASGTSASTSTVHVGPAEPARTAAAGGSRKGQKRESDHSAEKIHPHGANDGDAHRSTPGKGSRKKSRKMHGRAGSEPGDAGKGAGSRDASRIAGKSSSRDGGRPGAGMANTKAQVATPSVAAGHLPAPGGGASRARPSPVPVDTWLESKSFRALEWLLAPSGISAKSFFCDYWEQAPLVVRAAAGGSGSKKRGMSHKQGAKPREQSPVPPGGRIAPTCPGPLGSPGKPNVCWAPPSSLSSDRFSGLFSLSKLYELLDAAIASGSPMLFGHHVNACKCVDGEKIECNPAPSTPAEAQFGVPATRACVEALWRDGCTFQFHQPQQHSDGLYGALASLEEEFESLVGSNVYLTPPGSQGLAPHFDDIEAFVLQLEGRKHWKVYKPCIRVQDHAPVAVPGSPPPEVLLPTTYSRDLHPAAIGDPVLDVVLGPGDLLYFPRGWIHHANTEPGSYSTHVTISTYQNHTWGEMLAVGLPAAIRAASRTVLDLRRGLPIGFLSTVSAAQVESCDRESGTCRAGAGSGANVVTASRGSEAVTTFRGRLRRLLSSEEFLDALCANSGLAADLFAVDFVRSRLPPPWTPRLEFSETPPPLPPGPSGAPFLLRFVDPAVIRVVEPTPGMGLPPDTVVVYHSLQNLRKNHMLASGDSDSEGEADHGGDGADEEDGEGQEEDDEDEDEEEEEDEAEDEDEDAHGDAGPSHGVLHFPSSVLPALQLLVCSHPLYVRCDELDGVLGGDFYARDGLIGGLWTEGLLQFKPPTSK